MEIGEEVSSTSENDTKVSPCEEPMDVGPSKKPADVVPESVVESSAEKTEEEISSLKGIKINGDLTDEGPPSPKIVDSAVDSDNASAISSSGSNACSDVPDSSVTSSEPELKFPDQIQSAESEKPEDESKSVSESHSVAVSSETQSLAVSSETQSLAVSSETQSLAVSSESLSLTVSSESQSLAVSSESLSLTVSSESQSLAVSSESQSLALSSESQPLALSSESQPLAASSESQSLAISSPTISATTISSPKEQAPIVTCTKSDKTELSLGSLQNSSRPDVSKKDAISLVEKLALNSSITVSRKESKPELKADSPPPEGRVLRLRPIPKPEPPKVLSKPSKQIESRKTSTSSNNSNDKFTSKPLKSQKRKHDDGDGDIHEKNSNPIQYRGFKKIATVKEPVKKSIIKFNPFNPAFRRDCTSSESQVVCSNFDSSSLQPEYAQYLGLQPLVKFRCSNCGMSSFQTMNALNAHKAECTKTVVGVQQSTKLPYATGHFETSQEPKSANIKLTRKVFLCSACGTYYELWNLFLHMREAHRRYICLQCLGMSSSPEKLSEHLKQKHGIQAQVGDDPEKFTPTSMPPAFYLLCITCDKIYSEADKFATHRCQGKKSEESASLTKNNVVSSQTQTSDLPAAGIEVQSLKPPFRRTREASKRNNKLAQAKKESEAQKVVQKEVVEIDEDEPGPEKMEITEQNDGAVKEASQEPKEPVLEAPAHVPLPDTPNLGPNSDTAQPLVPDSVSEPPKQPEEPIKPDTTPDEQLVAEELAEMAHIIGTSVNQASPIETVPLANPEIAPGSAVSKVKAIRRAGPRKPTRKRKPLTFKHKPRKPKRVQVPILPVTPSGLLPNHLNSVDYPSEEPVQNSVLENPPEPALKSPTKSPTKTPSHEFLNKLPQLPPNLFKLKLNPEMDSENDSDDSQKLSLVVDESANNSDAEMKTDKKEANLAPRLPEEVKDANEIVLAGEDIQPMALTLDDKIENVPIQLVLKECVRTSCLSCNYCRHAHKIAVNGKYLALHLLSEHRYMPVKNETPEDVVSKLKNSLEVLENMCFNTETYDNTDPSIHVPYDQDTTFDCFQCNFACSTHKDLFAHKRKFHTKPLLLCIMCKTNFFSYSEMLCHLCPGHYKADLGFHNLHINFRCCFCRLDSIPSAFRLMVHLRKSHHTCDICLESCSDQQKLSTHLWKHKVNHLCYRCGISYASKPDITKHLFWKHGHESVLCKKCLQKKWPHVYHFCIPPTSFICEECSASFSKAVALKVHKRLHAEEFPYACGECEKKFISKKSLLRHEERHRNIELNLNGVNNLLPEDEQKEEIINVTDVVDVKEDAGEQAKNTKEDVKEKCHKKHKKDKKDKVVDLYDLPPLNLSSDSDSSDDEESPKKVGGEKPDQPNPEKDNETMGSALETAESSVKSITEDSLPKLDGSDIAKEDVVDTSSKTDSEETKPKPAEEKTVDKPSDDLIEMDCQVEGIWENFYKTTQTNHNLPYPLCAMKSEVAYGIIMGDHDYCIPTKIDPVIQDDLPTQSNLEQGFSDDRLEEVDLAEKPAETPGEDKKKTKSPKKKVKSSNDDDSSSSSDSSSGSDTSTCTGGTNCSCCSSSPNSSSSSSSDSDSSGDDKVKQERRKKKKERKAKKSETVQETVKEEEKPPEPELPRLPVDPPIQESELETDESSTDEEFYDKQPGKIANQIIAEKRNQLIQSVTPVNNGGVTEQVETPLPKGSPTKQRAKEKKRRRAPPKPKMPALAPPLLQTPPVGQFAQFPGVNTTPSMNFGAYGSPNSQLGYPGMASVSTPMNSAPPSTPTTSDDMSRSSKRRRIPNKFYGYSSGEEEERPVQKWRKPDATPPMPRPQPQPPPMAIPPPNTPRIQLTVPKQVIRKPSYHKVQKTPKITIAPPPAPLPIVPPPTLDSSETDSDADAASSQGLVPPPLPQYTAGEASSSKPEKDVYCYCRCPYDEVSEMIACDDETCPIEWFHFECVGILVPPRGQWFCPGCRKARGLPT